MHPSVKNAQARKNELHRLIDLELERIRASSRKDLDQARGVEEGLRRDVEQLRQRALIAAQASVRLRDLEREVDVNRGVYQSFLPARDNSRGATKQFDEYAYCYDGFAASRPELPAKRESDDGGRGHPRLISRWRAWIWAGNTSGAARRRRRPRALTGRIIRQSVSRSPTRRRYPRPPLSSRFEIELGRIGVPVVSWTGNSQRSTSLPLIYLR